ncbi:putative oxidoreductase OrdL [Lachnellula suecica]|uniref:Putative oxidoreductase OrdL n=1 Tax=Lachnellula suecica TaxID=602035 RepID=A0A8T9CF75_9HELO|nr:putative oxidoreductase OrdL [Lachnellula suecica]
MEDVDDSDTKPFPTKTSIPPFWRSELDPLDEYRSTESLPTTCDVLIIGGGYAGIAAAYHLLCGDKYEPGTKPSVVLVEARQACSGATARNGSNTQPPFDLLSVLISCDLGGHLKPSVYGRLPDYIERFGSATAANVADFEWKHIDAIAEVIKKEGIECDFEIVRTFNVYTDREQALKAKNAYLKLKSLGIAKETINDLVWTDEDKAQEVSGFKDCVGCFASRAATLWPYKLMMGLLSKAVGQGLNLQTNTPASSIDRELGPNGGKRWKVTTARGPISASKIIFATNGYTSALLPEYENKIIPARGIACHITLPPGTEAPKLPGSYGILLPRAWDYLNQRPDGSIIVGGARPTFFAQDSEWKNNVDDNTLIDPAAHYFDTYMQRHFVGWENSGAHVESIWTGIMGYNSDGLPRVGQVPGREGCFIAAGFGGHGMPVIWLVMKSLTEMVRYGKKFEQTAVPNIYKTTKERLESTEDRLNSQ